MINNSVYEGNDLVGYRCNQCGEVFSKMWGETCNSCRREEERHQEILAVLKNKQNKGKNDR